MSLVAQLRGEWDVSVLLRGEPDSLRSRIDAWNTARLGRALLLIWLGAGLYGGATGCWRSLTQGLFVAVKLPLIILLTTFGNTLLNAMLAPLLGLKATLRQSFIAILMSFVIAAVILGSFSPLVLFLDWNAPPMATRSGGPNLTYSLLLLMHVGVIALAGIIGNFRLLQLLEELSGTKAVARRVLIAWLAGNLFLGSQVSWILRPFIGSPDLSVEFFRAAALRGDFYEAVFHSLIQVVAPGH